MSSEYVKSKPMTGQREIERETDAERETREDAEGEQLSALEAREYGYQDYW